MALRTQLDRNWDALMALCEQERSLREHAQHPKVLRHVSSAIEYLAADMGFSAAKIRSRDFRAKKQRGLIVAVDQS
jgi:hypothetical protein